MTKPLTAAAQLAAARGYASPIYLAAIEFTAPLAQTLRISDRYIDTGTQEYLPLVADWGNLEETLNTLDPDGRPATAEFTLINNQPVLGRGRVSDLIRSTANISAAYEWAFAKVTISQFFEGLTESDILVLGVFYLEDPTEIGENLMRVRMTDQSLVIENAMVGTIVSRDVVPDAAPRIIGEPIPRVIGRLTDVPAMPVVAGQVGTLSGSLTSGTTTVVLVDATLFDAGDTVQIDIEQITLGSKGGSTFTGCTRGVNSTTAVAHDDLARVLEVRSSYIFAVGEHDANFKTKQITNIKVNGLPPRTSPSVTIDNSVALSGKRLATITFTPSSARFFHALPMGEVQIISVSAITVVGDGATYVLGTRTVSLSGPNAEVGPQNTRRFSYSVSASVTLGTTNEWTLSRNITGGAGVSVARARGTGTTTQWDGADSRDYASLADEVISFTALAGSGNNVTLTIVEYAVSYPAAGRSGDSTADLVIGDVTCDVQGIQDDGSGTISGTPTLLLENPTDVTRFIMRQLFGVTDFGTTWAATRVQHTALGYVWATLLVSEPFSRLRKRLGEQAQAQLSIEGASWEYEFLSANPAAQKVLDYARDVWVGMPAQVNKTARTDVRNSLLVSSQRNPQTGDFERVKPFEDLTQPGLATAFQDELELDFVQDTATADALGAYWLAWKKRQRFVVDLVAWWNVLDMDKVDYLAIDNHPILTAHGGSSLIFRIVGKQYLTGSENPARIQLRLIEVTAPVWIPGAPQLRRRQMQIPDTKPAVPTRRRTTLVQ